MAEMASSNFIGTLAEAISIIPEGPWWLVHERDAGDMGISKAIGMPRKEIEALLTICYHFTCLIRYT